MPILVLSAVGDEREKVRALEAGADDYVTKPFGPDELVARLRAALRRSEPVGETEPVIEVGGLVIDLAAPAGQPRRRGDPPDPDRVRPAAPPGAATAAGCSPTRRCCARSGAPASRTTPRSCASTSPTCGARSSRSRRRTAADPHRSGRRLPLRRLSGRSSRHLYAPAASLDDSLDACGSKLDAWKCISDIDHAIAARHGLEPSAPPSLIRRVRARAFTTGLDRALAEGADPLSDPTLALRAEHLSSTRTRRQLAAGLRDVVARAERPPRISAAAPIARQSVLANRDLIAQVAARLDSGEPLNAGGIAAVNLLLTDGTSPLWVRSDAAVLRDSLQAALISLGY